MSKAKLPLTKINPDGTVTVCLHDPIQVGEETVSELKFKKPKAKHLRGLDLGKMNVDDFLKLASNLTAEPPSTLDELSFKDLAEVTGVMNSFLDDFLKDGKTG